MDEKRKAAKAEFIKMYGEVGQHLDEDTWLNWYGVFMVGFEAGQQFSEQINEAELPSSDECLCSVGNEPYHEPWCPAAKSAIATTQLLYG